MYIMYECTLYLHVLKLVYCIVNYKYTCTCTYSPVYLWNLLDSSIILAIYKYMYMYVTSTRTCTCTYKFKFSSYMYMYMYCLQFQVVHVHVHVHTVQYTYGIY